MDDITPVGAPTNAQDLNTLLGRLLDEAEAMGEGSTLSAAASPAASAPPPSPQPPPPPAGGASPLAGLLAHPELLATLPTLVENLGPLLGGLGKGGGVGSAPSATRPHPIDRHTALLCAVKPYLSPHRREAAETVIRLCRVWDALERSGISLTGLLGGIGGLSAPSASADASAPAPAADREVT